MSASFGIYIILHVELVCGDGLIVASVGLEQVSRLKITIEMYKIVLILLGFQVFADSEEILEYWKFARFYVIFSSIEEEAAKIGGSIET